VKRWVISDTHFFHKKVAEYCGRPPDWQERIIANWQSMVADDDQVYHLGDLAFGTKEMVADIVARLPGQLIMIRGNHDQRSTDFYRSLGITMLPDPFYISGYGHWVMTHRPIPLLYMPYDECGFAINIHGHIHQLPSMDKHHVNVSVDVTDFKPVDLKELLMELTFGSTIAL
jgi:calcineurin-like phosphoesterase family protein